MQTHTPRTHLPHLLAMCTVAGVIAVWLHVLWLNGSLIPGAGPGDNLTFVWNLWWTRYALHHAGASVLFTPQLFYPFGADLTLHTNTLLPAIAASGFADPVVGQNALILAHTSLNFVAAYALAAHQTRDWRASLLAATLFGWSPFITAHLAGHFNLIAAWVLPAAALAALRMTQRPSIGRGVILGVILGATAYVDYYYLVFAVVLAATLAFAGTAHITKRSNIPSGLPRPLLRGMLLLLVVDLAALIWVLTTGGGRFRIAGVPFSVRGVANPLAGAWLLGVAWVALVAFRGLRLRLSTGILRARTAGLFAAGAALLVSIAPLAWRTARIWRAGDYLTQHYFWRSAPPGIDIATLFFGNPFSIVYGRGSESIYSRLGVDLVENVGWLTPGMIVLAVIGWRAVRRAGQTTPWTLPLLVFGVWALGPYAQAAGHGTTLWLPAVLLRWVPIVNNARIPARAIIVVYLACAMLAATGFVHLMATARRRALAVVLAALAVADLAPRRPPLYTIERPELYSRLRDAPPGAVLELPFGLRDGFGEIGRFDPRSMYFQTIHEHALVGGFEARLPRALVDRYNALPVIGTLLALSGGASLARGETLPSQPEAAAALDRSEIRYLVVNRRTSPPELLRFVQEVLPLDPIAQDGERTLFAVRRPGS